MILRTSLIFLFSGLYYYYILFAYIIYNKNCILYYRILHCWRIIAATTLKNTFLHKWTVSCSSQSFDVLLIINDITSRCQLSFRTLNHLSPSAGLITGQKPWAGCCVREHLHPSHSSLLGPDGVSVWCFSCRLRRRMHLL